ncbi:type-1 angiotensin II receptor B-like [Hydractinia symbiolongicarpus]|uniref:type-1 angiotensin II receptor B-like n=1 Tax=Hydractinia symbiolongicarpus TaxID=13093 RepID=UPI00254D89C8|nr:type-1 angiotensin II receptor B-like [Hydractinia symbiolongicarpus]
MAANEDESETKTYSHRFEVAYHNLVPKVFWPMSRYYRVANNDQCADINFINKAKCLGTRSHKILQPTLLKIIFVARRGRGFLSKKSRYIISTIVVDLKKQNLVNRSLISQFLVFSHDIAQNISQNGTNYINAQCVIRTTETLLLVGYCIVFVVGVIGNTIVLLTFKRSWRKGPIIELLIAYLAVFDLLSSVCAPLLFIYWTATCYMVWDFGWLGCKILPTLCRVFTDISIGVILTMAIDRCKSIVTPLRNRSSCKTIHIAVVVIIVLSCLCEAYYINGLLYIEQCTVVPAVYLSYSYPLVVFTVLRDVAFVLIFVVTTIAVYMKLKSSSNRRLLLSSQTSTRKHSQRGRVMKMLVVMAAVFTVTVIPRDILHLTYTILWITSPKNALTNSVVVQHINNVLKLLQVSNSIYNVFIYGKMHGHFWHNFKNILFCVKDARYTASATTVKERIRYNSSTYRQSFSFPTNIGRRETLPSESVL